MCYTKWESTESTPSTSFTFQGKKNVIEALRTRSSGNKIIWTEPFVKSKKFAKWKTTLNQRAWGCYENLQIKTHFNVSFNVHHFFMRKQFMCVGCYTGRLAFSNVILQQRAIRWILVASQAETRKDGCVPEVVAYEGNLILINYWREIL